jgi:spermidine synthase
MESIKQQLIYSEMMSHPVLFTHPHPKRIALIGEENSNITQEILKHPTITEISQTHLAFPQDEPRIKLLSPTDQNSGLFDIIIMTEENTVSSLSSYYSWLDDRGILLYQSTSPFELKTIKTHYERLKSQQFYDIQFISFPQPDYPTGWRSALMAIKNQAFNRIREKDIFNRSFTTKYYNFDVHKASLVLPEFMREELC